MTRARPPRLEVSTTGRRSSSERRSWRGSTRSPGQASRGCAVSVPRDGDANRSAAPPRRDCGQLRTCRHTRRHGTRMQSKPCPAAATEDGHRRTHAATGSLPGAGGGFSSRSSAAVLATGTLAKPAAEPVCPGRDGAAPGRPERAPDRPGLKSAASEWSICTGG